MSDPIAIIAPAVDLGQIERVVAAAHVALQDAERQRVASEQRTEGHRQEEARRRLDLGRSLVEARKAWPARGPKAKGWGEFLVRVGIEQDAALRMMHLAGYVEAQEVSRTDDVVREIPTVREVNAARREPTPTPLAADQPADDWRAEVEARREPAPVREYAPPSIDVDRELSKIVNLIRAVAQAVSTVSRKQMAHELREAARAIEAMP